jgi:hypothetical protein
MLLRAVQVTCPAPGSGAGGPFLVRGAGMGHGRQPD